MVKTQNIDTEMLDDAIENSGLKISHIVKTLGISRQAFDRKRKGQIAFRQSEIFVICTLLNLDSDTATKIFFP